MAGALVLAWAGQAGITLDLNCQTGGTCGKRESISRTRGHVGAWDPALKKYPPPRRHAFTMRVEGHAAPLSSVQLFSCRTHFPTGSLAAPD